MWKNVNDIYTSIRDYVKRKKVLWMVTNVKTVEEALSNVLNISKLIVLIKSYSFQDYPTV